MKRRFIFFSEEILLFQMKIESKTWWIKIPPAG